MAESWQYYQEYMGKMVLCTIPVAPYSEEWHSGMHSRTYIGQVCSHFEGGACLQPHRSRMASCIPLTKEMRLEVLPGQPHDYMDT